MPVPTDIKGFQIIRVKLPECSGNHFIYYRKHEARGTKSASDADGRLLFVFNMPIESNTRSVKKFFQQVAIGATVESFTTSVLNESDEDVYLNLTQLTSDLRYENQDGISERAQKLPKNCSLVTFIDKASLTLALDSLKKVSVEGKITTWPLQALGTEHIMKRVRSKICDSDQLSALVSKSLELFNQAEEDSRQELRLQKEIVDEDGFTLVVGTQSKTRAEILGKQKRLQEAEAEKAKKKGKKKEKDDFYRFQLREKKKEEMNDLLQKFKQDQERVKLMREKKRFRPY